MPTVSQATLKIYDLHQEELGSFILSCLPKRKYRNDYPLWDFRGLLDRDLTLEPVQVLEGEEYRYQIQINAEGEIKTNKPEILIPDDEFGRSGRLRTRLNTGILSVSFSVQGRLVGSIRIEVRSRKLDYLSDYRWMLRDIASQMAEIVAERFASTEQNFSPDVSRNPATLYQQFAFLRALIMGADFEAALAQILMRPHRSWIDREEKRSPTMGLQGNSAILRALVSPGRRQAFSNPQIPGLTSLPVEISSRRSIESLDTPENRFVKFVLIHWRSIVTEIQLKLSSVPKSYPVERGIRETEEVLARLDAVLSEELFREVGNLTIFPASSPVLSRREGYREIFHAYLQSEVAAQLTWEGGEDVYGAGQRNVATLYELWSFLVIAGIFSELCEQQPISLSELLTTTSDGLSLRLKRGKQLVLRGSTYRFGRQINIELYFNKSFTPTANSPTDGSWTRSMQPDISIRFLLNPQIGKTDDVTWLHFDAKYKIEDIAELFGNQAINNEEEENTEEERLESQQGQYKRIDLLKMHSYRDAVRRSTGAYILYPGRATEIFRRYHEIIPGIGAFPLRPSESGVADGTSTIALFIKDVLEHLALQSTQHERGRFWNGLIFESDSQQTVEMQAVSFLSKPPADTRVLVVKVESKAHYDWVLNSNLLVMPREESTQTVNLCLEEGGIDFVLIFSDSLIPVVGNVTGRIKLLTRSDLSASNYPSRVFDISLGVPFNKSIDNLPQLHIYRECSQRLQEQSISNQAMPLSVIVPFLELVRYSSATSASDQILENTSDTTHQSTAMEP